MGYWGVGEMGRMILHGCMDAWMHDCMDTIGFVILGIVIFYLMGFYFSFIQFDNMIGPAQGRGAVGNDDHSEFSLEGPDSLLNSLFVLAVYSAGGFIQEKKPGLSQQGPG